MQNVEHFFDQDTYTLTYVVYDNMMMDAIIIDPVLDYDQASSKVDTRSIDVVCDFIKKEKLKLHAVLETHAHADHLTGAVEFKKRYPNIKIGIGKNITKVQSTFKDVFNLKDFNENGVQFDLLLSEDEEYKFGSINVKMICTPGHTPACSSYHIGNFLFTGDALFMPDYGTGRCDFPLGSAKQLYHSIHEKLYKLDDETEYFTCHDYQPNGRELMYKSTIGESKKSNIQLNDKTTEEDFIKFRQDRDKTLAAPRLLLPSIQVNIDGGRLPKAEDNGKSYLRIPISNQGDQ